MAAINILLLFAIVVGVTACSQNYAFVRDNDMVVQYHVQKGKNWQEAVEYCRDIGLRLPDKSELVDRVSPAWQVPRGNYWTRTVENEIPCVVSTSYGISNCEVPASNRNQLTRCVYPNP